MKPRHDETSTTMSREKMLELLFPTQDTYREITADLLDMFEEQADDVAPGEDIEVASAVSKLEDHGHNRNTVYKVLNEYLVPIGIIEWKKFEGSMQLSNRFGNALRRFSVSWKNYIDDVDSNE